MPSLRAWPTKVWDLKICKVTDESMKFFVEAVLPEERGKIAFGVRERNLLEFIFVMGCDGASSS